MRNSAEIFLLPKLLRCASILGCVYPCLPSSATLDTPRCSLPPTFLVMLQLRLEKIFLQTLLSRLHHFNDFVHILNGYLCNHKSANALPTTLKNIPAKQIIMQLIYKLPMRGLMSRILPYSGQNQQTHTEILCRFNVLLSK